MKIILKILIIAMTLVIVSTARETSILRKVQEQTGKESWRLRNLTGVEEQKDQDRSIRNHEGFITEEFGEFKAKRRIEEIEKYKDIDIVDLPKDLEDKEDEEEEVKEADTLVFVEENPEYPGGEEARLKFLRENIVYPKIALETGLEGRVQVSFVVEPDGRITNVKILRGRAPSLDEEALRVAKLMPRWKPGKQRNRAVRVQYQMPITFTLN